MNYLKYSNGFIVAIAIFQGGKTLNIMEYKWSINLHFLKVSSKVRNMEHWKYRIPIFLILPLAKAGSMPCKLCQWASTGNKYMISRRIMSCFMLYP